MYPRTEYEMSKEDLKQLLKACKSTPVISFDGKNSMGGDPQSNANAAWQSLGTKMGFDYMTVKPILGKDNHFFTAVPSETLSQREERENKETEEKKTKRVKELKKEIEDREKEIKEILK